MVEVGGQVVATFAEVNRADFDFNSVATFSAYGPTLDGRVKPDLVAPGIVISAATSR